LLPLSGLLGALLGYLWLRNLLFYPPDSAVVAAEVRLRQEVADFAEPMQRSQEESERLASQRQEARRTLDRFQTAIRARKRRLLATDWRALRGDAFGSFLVEVFDDLGYSMESTKASGGQGADLILTRDGVKIAVQARGCEGSVGNSAVQEVFLGMTFFGCQRCCVVTNSTFTAVAKRLAANRGCHLIDGSQIPDLIRGKTTV
jgi:restriction system protein